MDNIHTFEAAASTVGKIGQVAVVDPATGKVSALAAAMKATDDVLGIIMNEVEAGGLVEVACHGAVVKAVISGAITKGAPVNSAGATGVAYATTAVKVIGRCLESGAAAGDMVDIIVLA